MSDREIMQQALAALQSVLPELESVGPLDKFERALAAIALFERLAQQEQERVVWEDVLGAIARGWTHDDNKHKTMDVQLAVAIAKEIQDMVIAPPQRKPLTDERIGQIIEDCKITLVNYCSDDKQIEFARAIEVAHGIKENT